MKTKEQILAWFKEQEWYQAFIKNIMNGKVNRSLDQLTEDEEKQSNIIQDAFSWNDTKEGYNYWKAVDIMYTQWLNKKTKICACCHRELPIEDFYTHKTSKDGLQPYCKECSKERSKETYNKQRRKMLIGKVAEDNDKKEQEELMEKRPLVKLAPVAMIKELANRGYYGIIMYREHKIETIEYNGHTGTFEYEEEHKINLQDFVDEKEK